MPTQNTPCEFCNTPAFSDERQWGSVRQVDGSLKNYHIDCLRAAYPNERDYQSLALKLFSDLYFNSIDAELSARWDKE